MMKIPKKIAERIQFDVALMAWDCYSPAAYFSGFRDIEGDWNNQRYAWQLTVDMLYRFIVCDLVEVSWKEKVHGYDEKTHGPIFEVLRAKDPNGAFHVEWIDELCPTDFCKQLIERYDLAEGVGYPDYQLCEPFVEELEALFERYGVPWLDEPLLPLKPTSD
jgi:hypothetical protein